MLPISNSRLLRGGAQTPPCRGRWQGELSLGTRRAGMVFGMAAKKVTITLTEDQLERIRALVAAGTASSVSGFVQHAVGVSLDDLAGWGAALAEALRVSGGPLTAEERTWADEVLGVGKRRRRTAA